MKRNTPLRVVLLLLASLLCALPGGALAQAGESPYAVQAYDGWKATVHDVKVDRYTPCVAAGKLVLQSAHEPLRILDVATGTFETLRDSTGTYVEACAPDASFLILRQARGKEFSWSILDRVAQKTVALPTPGPDEVPYSRPPGSLLSPDGTKLLGPPSWGTVLALPSGKRLQVLPFDSAAIRRAAGISTSERSPFQEAFWTRDGTRVVLRGGLSPEQGNLLAVLAVAEPDATPMTCIVPHSDERDVLYLHPLPADVFVAEFTFLDLDAPATWGLLRLSNDACGAKSFRIEHYGVGGTENGRILFVTHRSSNDHDVYEVKTADMNLETVNVLGRISIKDMYPMQFGIIHFSEGKMAIVDAWNNKIISFQR